MREVLTTSLVHMTHSYWPLSISSWIRVGRSAAEDLEALRRLNWAVGFVDGPDCEPGPDLGPGT